MRPGGLARLDGLRAATVAALVLVPLCILFLDRPVATAMHRLGRPAVAVSLTYIADATLPLAGLALLAAGLAALGGWQPGRGARNVLAAAVATLVARALADQLKFAFGRVWPETWVANNPSWIRDHVFGFSPFHGGRGWASFPSGHTIDIATPCAVLWRLAPRWRAVAAALVLAVAGGLLASDFHFLGDVLAGLYVGVVVAYGLTALIAS